MKLENDPLYPIITKAHEILPEVSCFEFIDCEEREIRQKLRKHGLTNVEYQNEYIHYLDQIRCCK